MIALVLAIGSLTSVASANDSIIERQTGAIGTIQDTPSFGFRNGSVIVAPIPFSNPMIGSGLALGAGYLFQLDAGSKPSMIGIGALRSDNDSEAYGATLNLAFASNRWIVGATIAQADINYDLYAGSTILPLNQSGLLARLNLSYGITRELSFGVVGRYLDTSVAPAFTLPPPLPSGFQPNVDIAIASYGLAADWDTRDDTIYPKNGNRLQVTMLKSQILKGPGSDYSKSFATYDLYRKLGQSGIVAMRLAICTASTSAPFYDKCSLGVTDAFRGFNTTQFLDSRSASAQVEYRRRLSERLGIVLFGGVGSVGAEFDALNRTGTAGGFGLRYRVSKKFPVDFAMDGSLNDQGDKLLYISVGQRY